MFKIIIDPATPDGKKLLEEQKQKSKYVAIGMIIFVIVMIIGMVMLYNKSKADQAALLQQGHDRQAVLFQQGRDNQAALFPQI
jgi:hypothetical protein